MEPEVHIIEKYFQEILHCFTMTNIKLKGNKEIDLLAIDPIKIERYHIEVRAWTDRRMKLKQEDLGYFRREKFEHPTVKQFINSIFGNADYRKVLIIWNTQDNFENLRKVAKEQYDIEIMGLRGIIHEFLKNKRTSGSRDDVLRVMELVSLVEHEEKAFLRKLDRLGESHHEDTY